MGPQNFLCRRRNPGPGFGVTLELPRGKGDNRHGKQGRFGGAKRTRDRLAGTLYLDALDHAELCSGAYAHALDCGDSAATLASDLPGYHLERQADAGFEIAAIVADADIAAQVDHFVAELHLDSTGKLTAEQRALWAILAAFVLFFLAFFAPRLQEITARAERLRIQEISQENEDYCAKWQMGLGTKMHDQCISDLQELRLKAQNRFADRLDF